VINYWRGLCKQVATLTPSSIYKNQKEYLMLLSECCGAKVIEDYDLCSKCLEHCDSYDDEEE